MACELYFRAEPGERREERGEKKTANELSSLRQPQSHLTQITSKNFTVVSLLKYGAIVLDAKCYVAWRRTFRRQRQQRRGPFRTRFDIFCFVS